MKQFSSHGVKIYSLVHQNNNIMLRILEIYRLITTQCRKIGHYYLILSILDECEEFINKDEQNLHWHITPPRGFYIGRNNPFPHLSYSEASNNSLSGFQPIFHPNPQCEIMLSKYSSIHQSWHLNQGHNNCHHDRSLQAYDESM